MPKGVNPKDTNQVLTWINESWGSFVKVNEDVLSAPKLASHALADVDNVDAVLANDQALPSPAGFYADEVEDLQRHVSS